MSVTRVSSVGQSLDVQLEKLKGCKKIFQEKKSGTSNKRSQLEDELKRKGVELQVLDQNINTGDATGRLLFNMLGAIAQFETEIRAERQMDGIAKAKQKGVRFGAQRKLDDSRITELKEKRRQGVLIKTLMSDYKLSKASVYRYLEKLNED